MKRLLLFSILLGLFFSGCSNDDNDPSGEVFFRCKLNGQLKEFNHTPTASSHLEGDPTNGLYISASDSDDFMNAAFLRYTLSSMKILPKVRIT
ncbi:hypothetical protein ACFSKL_04515 [Belliella marina]|uniref:Lipoprotein n=1 Tax=Belliella marina TaxID=1644146 RepID=A0ABW4VKJ0_9BACT